MAFKAIDVYECTLFLPWSGLSEHLSENVSWWPRQFLKIAGYLFLTVEDRLYNDGFQSKKCRVVDRCYSAPFVCKPWHWTALRLALVVSSMTTLPWPVKQFFASWPRRPGGFNYFFVERVSAFVGRGARSFLLGSCW